MKTYHSVQTTTISTSRQIVAGFIKKSRSTATTNTMESSGTIRYATRSSR